MNIRKFTLIELMVVMAIIAILFSMIFPVFKKAKHTAEITKCLANMKQIHTASFGYLMDNNKKFPGQINDSDPHQGRSWMGKKGSNAIWPKTVTQRPFNPYLGYTQDGIETPSVKCPLNDTDKDVYDKTGSSYTGNAYNQPWADLKNRRVGQVKHPASTVLSTEFGAMAFVQNIDKKYWRMTHKKKRPKYPFLRMDGSVIQYTLGQGEGYTFPSTTVNLDITFSPN